MKEINILFLGGAKRVSIAEKFKESAKQLNNHVNIFSYELSEEVPIAFIGKVIIGLKWEHPDILKNLKKIVLDYRIDIVIPFVDPAILLTAQLTQNLKKINK